MRREEFNMAFEAVAASQTAQVMGPNGMKGDILERVIIIPTTTSPGAVTIINGSGGTATVIFDGGATSVPSLAPIVVTLGFICGVAGGWGITTGANVRVICAGRFS